MYIACMYICIYVYMYTCTYVHVYIYIYMCHVFYICIKDLPCNDELWLAWWRREAAASAAEENEVVAPVVVDNMHLCFWKQFYGYHSHFVISTF